MANIKMVQPDRERCLTFAVEDKGREVGILRFAPVRGYFLLWHDAPQRPVDFGDSEMDAFTFASQHAQEHAPETREPVWLADGGWYD